MNGFYIPENLAADQLGLSHEALRRYRLENLARGSHFDLVKGRLLYSDAGLEAVRSALVVVGASDPASAEKTAPAAAGAVEVRAWDLVVERLCPNPTWVKCRVDGRLVDVRVRDNRRMVRGTRLAGVVHQAGRYVWSGGAR